MLLHNNSGKEWINGSYDNYIITILFLEHRLQFGNFAEVDPPPLLILRHDHIRLAYQTTSTSDMLCHIKKMTNVSGPRPSCCTSPGNANWYNLLGQHARLICCFAAAVWTDGVGVLLLSGDAGVLGCVLGTVALLKTVRQKQQKRQQILNWWNDTRRNLQALFQLILSKHTMQEITNHLNGRVVSHTHTFLWQLYVNVYY